MKIYNKTSQVQELRVYDRNDKRQYSIYVNSQSSTTLDTHISTPDLPKLVAAGIFQILDEVPVKTLDNPDGTTDCDHQCEECGGHCNEDEISEDAIEDSEDTKTPENVITETVNEDVDVDTDEDETPNPEDSPSKFICDVCGGEFASARGLTRHKSMAHSS